MFGNRAVITIRPTASLERQIGLDLVPLPDGRALISFDQPNTVAELELMLYDALQNRASPTRTASCSKASADPHRARRSDDVKLLSRSIIVLESTRRIGHHQAGAQARPLAAGAGLPRPAGRVGMMGECFPPRPPSMASVGLPSSSFCSTTSRSSIRSSLGAWLGFVALLGWAASTSSLCSRAS